MRGVISEENFMTLVVVWPLYHEPTGTVVIEVWEPDQSAFRPLIWEATRISDARGEEAFDNTDLSFPDSWAKVGFRGPAGAERDIRVAPQRTFPGLPKYYPLLDGPTGDEEHLGRVHAICHGWYFDPCTLRRNYRPSTPVTTPWRRRKVEEVVVKCPWVRSEIRGTGWKKD